MKKQLVIGLGEIGTAIQNILECEGYDSKFKEWTPGTYDVIHVCFPYTKSFIFNVREYQIILQAKLVIVHSTVPVGICDANGWVHSPVRGVHPKLEEGIRTFVKFFGGLRASEAAAIFRKVGIKTMITLEAKDTEALKLWDTTIYGMNILIEKSIKQYCERNGVDFNIVYKLSNMTYNEGYLKLGHPEYQKYVLKDFPGPIGGHCVQENWELLDDPIVKVSKALHKRLSDS